MKWTEPGCRGRFYYRGKTKIIWYYIDGKRKSLKLKYSKKNKIIAAEVIRQEELSGIDRLESNRPQDLKEAWELFKNTFTGRKAKNTITNTKFALTSLIGDNYDLEESRKLTKIVEGNIQSSSLMPRSVNSYLASLKAFFNWLKENNYITDNPVKQSLKLKVPDKQIEIYSEDELQQIFDYWKTRNKEFYLFFRFLYETAFRLSEGLTLTWKQVKFGKKWHTDIFLPKSKFGDRKETFPLYDEIKTILEQVKSYSNGIATNSKVFTLPHRRNILKHFDRSLENLEIPKHVLYQYGTGRALHTFRKTRMTHWVEKQFLPEIVVEKLSRDNYETVRKYYVNLDNMQLHQYMKSFAELKKQKK